MRDKQVLNLKKHKLDFQDTEEVFEGPTLTSKIPATMQKPMKSKSLPATSKAPRLRVGLKGVSQTVFAEAVGKKLGKQRVSIMIDNSVVDFFKRKAGDRGYQTLINQALQQAMLADQLEVTLRKVIREELRNQ